MFRRMIPLAVAILLVLGCKKKPTNTDPDGGDLNATYTIKIREQQQGDKVEVVITEKGATDISTGGVTNTIKHDTNLEYIDTILEMPAGADRPTKLTRTYKKAEQYDLVSKTTKTMSIQGKIVNIEKKGKNYEFTSKGKKLDAAESFHLQKEFGRETKAKVEDMLPKTAVKVGEPWTVDPASLKSMMSSFPFPIDTSKSKLTGTLTGFYTKNVQQWGTITFDFDLALDPKAAIAGGELAGTVKLTGILDAPIDVSGPEGTMKITIAPEGTMKITIRADVTGKQQGNAMKVDANMEQSKTVKLVK